MSAKNTSCFVLVGLYGAVLLAAMLTLSVICCKSLKRLRTRVVYFYVFTIVITICMSLPTRYIGDLILSVRTIGWTFETFWDYEENNIQFFVHSLLFSLPPLLLVSTFSILISYWADEYIHSRTQFRRNNTIRKRIIIAINVILYVGEVVVLCIVFYIEPPRNFDIYREAQGHFLNVLYIAAITCFILYGFALYRQWKHRPIRKSLDSLKRVQYTLATAIVVSVSFVIRVVVNALWARFIINWTYRYPFEATFYTLIEIVPIVILLFFMLKYGFRGKNRSKTPLLNATYDFKTESQSLILSDDQITDVE